MDLSLRPLGKALHDLRDLIDQPLLKTGLGTRTGPQLQLVGSAASLKFQGLAVFMHMRPPLNPASARNSRRLTRVVGQWSTTSK